ncbi:MAG: family 43 glycosylhydrolase [Clostridia bacterium]|nr:family 43 glycosylhydrolase [Clostridia bacterium]
MKLKFDKRGKTQPDPFIFRDDNGKLYLYATGFRGVQAYSADRIDGVWHYEGMVLRIPRGKRYWAPSMLKHEGKYYLYFSYHVPRMFEHMHVAVSDSPLGPFTNITKLYERFTIDSHAVKTEAGLFLFYAENNENCGRAGTRVFVDKLLDPLTPANFCKEVVSPTRDEEITGEREGKPWHTVEGPFYIRKDGWQYVMYSGGAFTDDTYHIGYAAAKTDEEELTKIEFEKFAPVGDFRPVMATNEREEGVGHHSVIEIDGEFYAVYHARDIGKRQESDYKEVRTARFCKLKVENGVITAEQE